MNRFLLSNGAKGIRVQTYFLQSSGRSASTSAPKKSAEILASAGPVTPVEEKESYLSAEDDRLPDGRQYVLWKGKKYPFPWRGEVEENFSPALINKWVAEGKWCPIRQQPRPFLKNTHEKIKIWQMYYALRMKQGLPVYKIGIWDHNLNVIALGVIPLFCIFGIIYNLYYLLGPPEMIEAYKNRFSNGRAAEFGEKVEGHH